MVLTANNIQKKSLKFFTNMSNYRKGHARKMSPGEMQDKVRARDTGIKALRTQQTFPNVIIFYEVIRTQEMN